MFDGWKRGKLTTNSGATRNSFLFDFHPRLGGLHLFKQLAVKSSDLSQAQKKKTAAEIQKMTTIFTQNGQKLSFCSITFFSAGSVCADL